jgi:hypothetical protein
VDLASGQLPFETAEGCTASISQDHAAELGGKSVKVVFAKKETALSLGYWGAGPQPGSDWSAHSVFRFEAFSTADKLLGGYLAVRDREAGYEARADMPFKLQPGLNKVEFPISTIVRNNGKLLDKAHITQWYLACDQEATIYFANFRLEKE